MKKILIPVALTIALAAITIFYISKNRLSNNHTLALSGTIEAVEIDLAFKAPGKISYVRYDDGDRISKGDTVSELSHLESEAGLRQIDDQIAASRSQMHSLEIQKETLARNLGKVSSLVGSGGATLSEQEDLQDRLREADAALAAASSSIKALASQKQYLEVIYDNEFLISPIDGSVILRAMEPGEIVSSGKTVLTVADLKNLEIKVYLPEIRLGLVKEGQKVFIEVDSFPGRRFDGIISKISDKAEFTPKNVQTREERVKTVYAVKVRAGDYDGILKPGMPCDVFIDINR